LDEKHVRDCIHSDYKSRTTGHNQQSVSVHKAIEIHNMAIHQESDTKLQFEIEERDPLLLPTGFLRDWLLLEQNALEPSFYLSPYFVLPALQHLPTEHAPKIYAVRVLESPVKKLVGFAILGKSGPVRGFPLPSLVAFQSIYSYLSGFLLDEKYGRQALQCLFNYFRNSLGNGDGIRLQEWRSESAQGKLIQPVASDAGFKLQPLYSYERATLRPAQVDEEQCKKSTDRSVGKDFVRRLRCLKDLGEISSCVFWGKQVTEDAIEQFLALEDRDWAGEQKTSLLAAGHESFLRQVFELLRDTSRIFVAELLLNCAPIASALNFTAGSQGFALKIGWDQNLQSSAWASSMRYCLCARSVKAAHTLHKSIAAPAPGLISTKSGLTGARLAPEYLYPQCAGS
jgi:hypothetical protein